jgi:hypothetical protein
MIHDMRDWLGFAMTAVSLGLSFYLLWASSRRRIRRVERSRSFKAWGIEWTAHDREDDRRV